MTRELIIVGASVRAAAFSAIRAGFQPYAIDQYADRDLAAVCPAVRIRRYPDDFVKALGDAPAAPWLYTGGLENYPRLVDRLAEIRPLWGNRGNVLRRVRDPFVLSAALRQAGFQFPPTARELSENTNQIDQRSLKKPFRSCGGRRIQVVAGPQPASPGFYYQTYLPGRPWSAVFVAARGGCRLLGVSRQITGQFGEFAYRGSIVCSTDCCQESQTCLRLGALVAAEFELRGLFNIDLIHNGDGWWPLEVNPRYSASMEVLERAAGLNTVTWHAAAFDELPNEVGLPPMLAAARSVGKAILYADHDGSVPMEFDRLVKAWNSDSDYPAIADLPPVGEPVRKGQPICTVFAEGQGYDKVERALGDRIDQVRQILTSGRLTQG
jgi:predicted ATP-grasp superfamily ATP-dependent carboligase